MSRLSSFVSPRLFLVAALAVAGVSCGGSPVAGIPFVPAEGGIPDRVIYDQLPGQADSTGDADDAANGADDGGAADGAADGNGDGNGNGDGDNDGNGDAETGDAAEVAPSQVAISVDVPADNAIVPTQKPLVPTITVTVTLSPGVTGDDLATVTAEVWSTGPGAKMQSSTKLTLTSRPGAETPGAVEYLFAETPLDLTQLASGTFELHVTATTNASVTGTATRAFRADAGPRVTAVQTLQLRSAELDGVTVGQQLLELRDLVGIGVKARERVRSARRARWMWSASTEQTPSIAASAWPGPAMR